MAAKKTTSAKSQKSAPRSSSRSNSGKERSAGARTVTIDRRRRERREAQDDESAAPAAPAKLERREKVQRRRQIDPTTCERDYTLDEVEFMNAMDEYKRKSGRMFPTCSEVLEVIRGLGYVKASPADRALLAIETLEAECQILSDAAAHQGGATELSSLEGL